MKILKIFCFLIIAQLTTQSTTAQIGDPKDYVPFEETVPDAEVMRHNDPGCDPDDLDCIPIDGGVVGLLAAGVGYGIKRVRDARRRSHHEGADA